MEIKVYFFVDFLLFMLYNLNVQKALRGGLTMNFFDQEALDYFYEELESYYDEDELGEIFDGFE